MKKKNVKLLTWVLLALLVGFSSCKPKKKTDWEKENLKGKVKSYTNFTYKAVEKFGEIQKGERIDWSDDNYQIIYDNKGNMIEKNGYNSNGNLIYKIIYKYDNKGNKMEYSTYNSNGNLNNKWTNKYDSKGNKIESSVYNSDGNLGSKYTYKYDSKGNKIEENRYYSDGSLNYKWTYKYDNRGNKIEKKWYKSDGSLWWKNTFKYEYDKHGNWIKQIIYKNDKPYQIVEREYEYYE